MDDEIQETQVSFIELNDSSDSVEIVETIEEGELAEADAESPPCEGDNGVIKAGGDANTLPSIENNADDNVVFEIKFKDQNEYDRLYTRIIESLKNGLQDESELPLVFTPNAMDMSISARNATGLDIDTTLDSSLFLIDTTPTPKNAAEVPSYKRHNTDVLDEQTPLRKKQRIEAVDKCYRPKATNSCFNCGEIDHSLRECPQPRNVARINRARMKKLNRVERYHVDTEQRFAHIRPGKISSKTRRAMGYSVGELPFFFYRMRRLGYPPGWLEDAKVQSSGLTLFNEDGQEVQKSDEEEGETGSFKYDINKIVDFPGFNVHPGPRFYDDYEHHDVPPFQEQQLKANFIKSLGLNVVNVNGYKRKKLKLFTDSAEPSTSAVPSQQQSDNLKVLDMDLENDLVDEPAPSHANISPSGKTSPTLEDLQAHQAQLLHELENSGDVSESSMLTASGLNESASVSTPTATLQLTSPRDSSPITPAKHFKASYEGTPILKFSIYDKLPVGDKFKVGVSDVINFENLPDSTGKYEQMKDVLQSVRQTMQKLQAE